MNDIIKELLQGSPEEIIERLKKKSVIVPLWDDLKKEYNPKEHPVMSKSKYPDIVKPDGTTEEVSRIALGFQKLATKRMTELMFGIDVKRIYKTISDKEKEVAKVLEAIFLRNRINSVNIERGNMLYGGCEVFTLWYAVEAPNTIYGIESNLKIRCKNYSPINGDGLYPTFDEYGDMLAMGFSSKRKDGDKEIEYFDVYTDTEHIRYKNDGGWTEELREQITIAKIPGVYSYRSMPIWEDNSNIVYESEAAISRNGNYLRKNSKPILAVFGDENIDFGDSDDNAPLDVVQYSEKMRVEYITWQQAVENLKFYITELRQAFFTQLQLPDFSFESMKTTPMSGEARKMMFIDAQLKVRDESGAILEILDREVNVVKAFLKIIMPSHVTEIDSLQVETIITPFTITDEKDTITNIMTATGGKPIMSQREGIENLGWSDDVDRTMQQIADESMSDTMEPTI